MDSFYKLLDFYRKNMPKEVYLVKDEKRYNEVMDAIKIILEFVESSDERSLARIKPDELTGCNLCLSIIGELVIFDCMDKLYPALRQASNFEVCLRTDKKFEMNFMFENVYQPAMPYTDNN